MSSVTISSGNVKCQYFFYIYNVWLNLQNSISYTGPSKMLTLYLSGSSFNCNRGSTFNFLIGSSGVFGYYKVHINNGSKTKKYMMWLDIFVWEIGVAEIDNKSFNAIYSETAITGGFTVSCSQPLGST